MSNLKENLLKELNDLENASERKATQTTSDLTAAIRLLAKVLILSLDTDSRQ